MFRVYVDEFEAKPPHPTDVDGVPRIDVVEEEGEVLVDNIHPLFRLP